MGLAGSVLDPTQPNFDPASAYHFVYPLTQYIAKKKRTKARNLLERRDSTSESGGSETADEDEATPGPVVGNYYHPNASLSFIPASGVLQYLQTPSCRASIRPSGGHRGA